MQKKQGRMMAGRGKTKANSEIRETNGNLLIDNEDIANRWKQNLQVLYQSEEITSLKNKCNPDNEGAPKGRIQPSP